MIGVSRAARKAARRHGIGRLTVNFTWRSAKFERTCCTTGRVKIAS
jgi:hypothetical protein